MSIQPNKSLRTFNTFGVDCVVRGYAAFSDEVSLRVLLRKGGEEAFILGGGSNILLPARLDRYVFHNCIGGIRVLQESDCSVMVEAGAGVVWHDLVTWAVDRGLGGIENLALIPGTVGAAPIQNIGAYGVELEETFSLLTAMERATGKLRQFDRSACAFGYRNSVFKGELKDRFVILSIVLNLTKSPELRLSYGDILSTLQELGVQEPGVRHVYEAVIHIRRSKLPDPNELGNAGSFFKNPVILREQWEALKSEWPEMPGWPAGEAWVKVPAGWLIEQSGWKGLRRGDCGVHQKQALVIVNYGHATGRQILDLADEIAQDVQNRFGIGLEKEVNVLL